MQSRWLCNQQQTQISYKIAYTYHLRNTLSDNTNSEKEMFQDKFQAKEFMASTEALSQSRENKK
jgi:glutathione synthase/RimK-type ligase-like ATP-grasp enzyme